MKQLLIAEDLQPTYNFQQTYEWNFRDGPVFNTEIPPRPTSLNNQFLGLDVGAPIGVAAGPLLNSAWVKLYSSLGFDILTYKTVRSVGHPVYAPPNMLFVNIDGDITDERLQEILVGGYQRTKPVIKSSMANTFGMPSLPPVDWRKDVTVAKKSLQKGQILVVSVVGTSHGKQTDQELADDFAKCAGWAIDSGADVVEVNLSCPNVSSHEGSLYRNPDAVDQVVTTVKSILGSKPLLAKIGYFDDKIQMDRVLEKLAPVVDGITAINTIPLTIIDLGGKQALPGGTKCGVGGTAIKAAGLQMIRHLCHFRNDQRANYAIVGVGGIMSPSDAEDYFHEGADAIEIATGAILDPYLALRIHLQGVLTSRK